MAHNMLNMTAHAGGGTLLTGGGGDELLSRWGWRRPDRAQLRRMPLGRRARWTAVAVLPVGVRQRVAQTRWERQDVPWLRPSATAELNRRAQGAPRGRTYAESIALYLGGRYYEVLRAALETFAADNGVRLVEPFYDRRFAMAAAREAPRTGFPTRTAALERFFSDLLPIALLRRSTKAVFNASLWGSASRQFASEWDGRGVDPGIVDPGALRAAWAREPPDGRALAPLQRAYWCTVLAPMHSSS
jgi:asparagine synthase (glutamine-hydrolysing)